MYNINIAENQHDVDQAFNLAFKVFNTAVSLDNYANNKKDLWFQDPTYSIENFVLAKVESKVIGVIRLVPREFTVRDKRISILGISSVCVDDDYRGIGISKQLMLFVDKIAKQRGINVLLLFARRAVDHYYNKFNYFGVSNYSKLKINLYKTEEKIHKLVLTNFEREFIPIYSKSFDFSYEKYLLKAYRNSEYWEYVYFILNSRKDLQFKTIQKNEAPIGYILYSRTSILEYGILDGFNQLDILKSIIQLEFPSELTSIEIEINSSHKLNEYLFFYDYTRSLRNCFFGGHMIKVCNFESDKRDEISNIDIYQKTLNFFGAYSESNQHFIINKCIDFPILDQF